MQQLLHVQGPCAIKLILEKIIVGKGKTMTITKKGSILILNRKTWGTLSIQISRSRMFSKYLKSGVC
jgi:hypothetical protein